MGAKTIKKPNETVELSYFVGWTLGNIQGMDPATKLFEIIPKRIPVITKYADSQFEAIQIHASGEDRENFNKAVIDIEILIHMDDFYLLHAMPQKQPI
jgi:hypothetical protein